MENNSGGSEAPAGSNTVAYQRSSEAPEQRGGPDSGENPSNPSTGNWRDNKVF